MSNSGAGASAGSKKSTKPYPFSVKLSDSHLAGIKLVFVDSEGCSSSKGMGLALEELEEELSIEVVSVSTDSGIHLPNYSTPWVMLVKDGEVIDATFQGWAPFGNQWKDLNKNKIYHLLNRNEITKKLGNSKRPDLKEHLERIITHKGQRVSSVENTNLSNQDMSGFDFTGSILSGSNFENTNFEKADFSNTVIFNSSFLNANLKGAVLDQVYWKNVICPDGSLSDLQDYSCFCCVDF